MPGRDGTGPMGKGSMTGRGFGFCSGSDVGYGAGLGMGLGRRRGCGRYGITDVTTAKTQKELLAEQKKLLESRLSVINKELENL